MELLGKVHVIPLIHPVSNSGASTVDIFSMEEYNHALIILDIGATDGTMVITMQNCTAANGTGGTDIGFNYREMATTDTWGALTAVALADAATGFTVAADDDNHLFAIEIDADELTDTYEYVELTCAAPSTGNTLISAIAILSEPRYAKDVPVSAID